MNVLKSFFLSLFFISSSLVAMRQIGEPVIITKGRSRGQHATISQIMSEREVMEKGFRYADNISKTRPHNDSEYDYFIETFNHELPRLNEKGYFYMVKSQKTNSQVMVYEDWISSIPSQNPTLKIGDTCKVKNEGTGVILGILSDLELQIYLEAHFNDPKCKEFLDNILMEIYGQPTMIDEKNVGELITKIPADKKPIYVIQDSTTEEYNFCFKTEIASL